MADVRSGTAGVVTVDPVGPDVWVDVEGAAIHLARIYDHLDEVPRVRRLQWQRRIWTWMSRARAAGEAGIPATRREGRRTLYRLVELRRFAAVRVAQD